MNFYVILIALAASMGGLLAGYDMGIISGALLFIKNEWTLSASAQGWLVSSAVLGCFVGVLVNGYLADIFGRKKIILTTGIIFFAGSLMSALSPDYSILVFSRIIVGFAVGMATFAVPLYLSEIAPKKLRGTFVSLFQLSLTFGILFAYFVNAIFAHSQNNWRLMLLAGVVPSLVLVFALFPLGDSPRWLIVKNKRNEAEKVLIKLGQENLITEIESGIEVPKRVEFEKWIFYPLFLGVMIMFAQICTGINTIIYYAPTIFQFAGFKGELSAIMTTMGLGVANFLMTFVAIFLSDKIGRKPLVYWGLGIMCISMFLLGLIFKTPSIFVPYSKMATFLCVLTYICAFSFSLGPVTYILTSELFPLKFRGFLMSISFGANFVFNFIVVFLFLPLINKIGAPRTFWIFALICVFSLVFYKIFIPETKGVSLEEIEENFKHKTKKFVV